MQISIGAKYQQFGAGNLILGAKFNWCWGASFIIYINKLMIYTRSPESGANTA